MVAARVGDTAKAGTPVAEHRRAQDDDGLTRRFTRRRLKLEMATGLGAEYKRIIVLQFRWE
jgi:hypothetical protein